MPIILIDSDNNQTECSDIQAAFNVTEWNIRKKYQVYASSKDYAELYYLKQHQNDLDRAGIINWRMCKSQCFSWSDIDEINEMCDTLREKIVLRPTQLSYRGEILSNPSQSHPQ